VKRQKKFVPFVPAFAMLAAMSVASIKQSIAGNVQKPVSVALKNVEKWQHDVDAAVNA
jgi:hypothetical protein